MKEFKALYLLEFGPPYTEVQIFFCSDFLGAVKAAEKKETPDKVLISIEKKF
jgi:hypothetical protein